MDDADRISTLKTYLRRKYALDLLGLKALADRVVVAATQAVTITGTAHEGGSGQGTITFEPMAYLAAVEEIIAEFDPDAPPPAPISSVVRFLHPSAPDPRFFSTPPGA